MRLPDFYLIGLPKCGTTSVSYWLNQHALIKIPEKEPGYYSQDFFDVKLSYDDYLWKYKDISNEYLIGDCSPKYIYSLSGLKSLLSNNPSAKLILILRPFEDFFLSLHAQWLKEGVESIIDPNIAYSTVRQASGDSRLNYPLWIDIHDNVDWLLKNIDASNILILTIDSLKTDSSFAYARILGFLGLPYQDVELVVSNVSSTDKSVSLNKFILSVRKLYVFLLKLFKVNGFIGGTGLIKLFNSFNRRNGRLTNDALSDDIRHVLQCKYNSLVLLIRNYGVDL